MKVFKRLLVWIVLLVAGMSLEHYFRTHLYDSGINYISVLQQYIEHKPILIKYLQGASFLNTKYILMGMVMLFFNFIDVYSTLLLVIIINSAAIATGFFKLIYKNPRPFFHEVWVKVYDCETGYGNPSGHSIVAVCVYLTIWRIFCHNKLFRTNFFLKFMGFITVLGFILITVVSRLALGAHSLNQVFFGSFLGLLIYGLFFYVFKMEINPETEMKVIMKKSIRTVFFLTMLAILGVGYIVFNFVSTKDFSVEKWISSIVKNCPGTPYSKLLVYEAYFMLSTCGALVGSYVGIYFDVNYNLKGNVTHWVLVYFGNEDQDSKEQTDKFKGWNKTSVYTSFVRLFAILFILAICLSPNFIISSKSNTNLIFLVKNFFCYFFAMFIFFGKLRIILSKLKLTNNTEAAIQSYFGREK